MVTTIEQQVALDEAPVPSTNRLRIGRSNFRLPSDIQSKESTLQVAYDVLRRSPFFKAFLVTASVPKIYMQEFWATAYVHQHSIRFKMDSRKNIVDLEAFREMLHISPRVSGQSFDELPFEEEILDFLWNTKAYKEYYVCATGEAAPKPKASARRKRGGSDSSTTPPTAVASPRPPRSRSVKSQVKEQVSRILPRIEESVNAQLEAEVLTRSSHSSRTSYAIAAEFTEMELDKILMEKMEGNKSIQRYDEQRNLYKALVDAYEEDKTILESNGDTAILKRRRGDDDDQEGPSTGSDRGSKRRREGGEPESANTPSEPATRSASRSTTGTQSRQMSASESAFAEEPPLSLIPDNRGRRVIPFAYFINNDLEYLQGVNRESALDVYSKRRIIAVTELKIVEWHNYKHLDWTLVRRDDDKIYKFKEGDFKRLRLQDIKDMRLLLVQGKVSNLTVEERFAFNVSLRMFTKSIVIQRRVEV
nr:hypothetical protein [Tanacetum cinerariifolium]